MNHIRRIPAAMAVTLEEITDHNREAVLALRVAPGPERFVCSVEDSLAAAGDWPEARPWYRAVFASDEPAGPVGFVMISWNCEPQPPEIIGPWLLWKLLIDQRYQGRGYAAAVVRQVAQLVRAEGATELLTSFAPEDDWFAGFCQRLGFVPTGEYDDNGEVIVRLALPSAMAEHPNAELARKAYKAMAEGDLATVFEGIADDVVWHGMAAGPLSGTYHGRDEVVAFFGRVMEETGGTFRLEVHDVLANDEHIVVLCTMSATRGNKSIEIPVVNVSHGRDGKVTEFWPATTDAQASIDFWS